MTGDWLIVKWIAIGALAVFSVLAIIAFGRLDGASGKLARKVSIAALGVFVVAKTIRDFFYSIATSRVLYVVTGLALLSAAIVLGVLLFREKGVSLKLTADS